MASQGKDAHEIRIKNKASEIREAMLRAFRSGDFRKIQTHGAPSIKDD
jgi:hypothetical protein